MADTTAGVVFKITANPEQAAAALKQFQAQGIAVSSELRKSFATLAQSSADATAQVGRNTERIVGVMRAVGVKVDAIGTATSRSMKGAVGPTETLTGTFSNLSGTVDELNGKVGRFGTMGESSIRQIIGPLRTLRMLEYSTLGLISVGFYISEWARVVGAIENGIDALQGYDQYIREIQADTAKLAETSLAQFGKLTGLQELALSHISDAHQRQSTQLKEQIKLTTDQVAKIQELVGLIKEYRRVAESPIKKIVPARGEEFVLQPSVDITKLNQIQKTFQKLMLANGPQLGLLTKEQIEHPIKSLDLSNEKTAADLLFKLSQNAYTGKNQIDHFQASLNELADKALPKTAKRLDSLSKSQQRLNDEMEQFQFQGYVQELKAGTGFTKQQIAIADAIAKSRWGSFKSMMKDAADFQKAAGRMEYESLRSNLKAEEENLRTMAHGMGIHGRNIQELQKAIQGHRTFAGENLSPLGQTMGQFNQHLRMAGQMAGVATQPFSRMKFELAQLKQGFDITGVSAANFADAIGKNAAAAVVYGNDFGKAMEKSMKATVASLAGQAFVWSLYAFAMGLWDIFHNPAAAATDFESAALFGAIGGAAAAIGSAIPGGGAGGRGAVGGGNRGTVPGHGLHGSPGEIGSYGGSGGGSGKFHQTNLYIYGGGFTNTSNIQNLVTSLNQNGQAGTIRLNVTGSSYSIPNPSY